MNIPVGQIPGTSKRPFEYRKLIRNLLVIIPVGAAVSAFLIFYKGDLRPFRGLSFVAPQFLILALGLALVPWLSGATRTYLWTRFLGERFSLREMVPLAIGCDLGAAITPTAVGGGYVKLALLVEKGMSPGQAASIITLATVEDFLFFLVSVPVSFFLTTIPALSGVEGLPGRLHALAFRLSVGAAVLILFLLIVIRARISFLRRFRHIIRRFWTDFLGVYQQISRRGKRILVLNVFLSALQWTCRYSVITALLASLGVAPRPIEFFLLQWVVFTIGTATPSPGGMGGVEAAFYFLYRPYIPEEIIGPVTAGWRFLTFYLQLCIGLALFTFWYRSPRLSPASPKAQQAEN